MDVLGHDADEIERLRGLIADLCDPKPGCWQRALKAGRAEVARPAATPRGAVSAEMVERGAQYLIASYSWADPSDNDLAWRVSRGLLRAALDPPSTRGAV